MALLLQVSSILSLAPYLKTDSSKVNCLIFSAGIVTTNNMTMSLQSEGRGEEGEEWGRSGERERRGRGGVGKEWGEGEEWGKGEEKKGKSGGGVGKGEGEEGEEWGRSRERGMCGVRVSALASVHALL